MEQKVSDDVAALEKSLAGKGVKYLMASAFEADRLTLDVFGPAMHEAWINFKREEWSSYHNHVSD